MKRILIVDQDENVLIGLEWTLEAEGYSTTTAWSRQEALELSRQTLFDLLLIDAHLGDLDSELVVEEIRTLQPEAAVVLMHTRKAAFAEPVRLTRPTVCKWEHDEVKARVRSCLAA